MMCYIAKNLDFQIRIIKISTFNLFLLIFKINDTLIFIIIFSMKE